MTHEFINLAGTLHPMHDFINGDVACSHLIAQEAQAYKHCEEHGHDWIDHNDFGPDSGTESHECARCNFSFSHTWY